MKFVNIEKYDLALSRNIPDEASHQYIFSKGIITYTCTITRINRPTPFAVTTTATLRPRVAD